MATTTTGDKRELAKTVADGDGLSRRERQTKQDLSIFFRTGEPTAQDGVERGASSKQERRSGAGRSANNLSVFFGFSVFCKNVDGRLRVLIREKEEEERSQQKLGHGSFLSRLKSSMLLGCPAHSKFGSYKPHNSFFHIFLVFF